MAQPWPSATAGAPGVGGGELYELAGGLAPDSGEREGAEPPCLEPGGDFLTDAERAELDARCRELHARQDGLVRGSLDAHLSALGDIGRARAAYERSICTHDENLSIFELHLARAAASATPASFVTPSAPANPRRGVPRTVPLAVSPNWAPPATPAPHPLRKALWRIRAALRTFAPERQRNCGWAPSSPGGVAVVVDSEGCARWSGLQHCGSVWACAVCGAAIRAKRAEEISEVVTMHGRERVVMMTLTVRHAAGHSLRAMRRGLANAYRALARGDSWRELCRRLGIIGSIRALEVTHGQHGWHPHIHALLFLDEPPRGDELEDGWHPAGEMRERGKPAVELLTWLRLRWATMVGRYMGEEHAPELAIGAELTANVAGDYLSKLGLELGDPSAAKSSKAGNRAVMRIADDYAKHRRPRDGELWREYADAMKGAKMLTWSKGARWLRKRAGIVDRSDQELAEDEEQITPTDQIVAVVPWGVWKALRSNYIHNQTASTWLLSVIERYGARAIAPALTKLREAIDQARHNTRGIPP